MKRAVLLLVSITATLLGSGTSKANIIYTLNDPVGTALITGTITTNGATGTLSTGDLISWNLTAGDGVNSFDLTENNSGERADGSDLSANATQLLFNFSDSAGGYLFFQSPSIGQNGPYICFISSSSGCFVENAIVLDPTENSVGPKNPYVAMTGTQVIGSVAVPEPSTLALLGAGLAGLGALRRRRKAIKAV